MLNEFAASVQQWLPDVDGAVADGMQALAAIIALILTWRLFILTRAQTNATNLMAQLQKADADEREVPAVVLDLVVERPNGGRHYVARNVGRGPSLNTFIVDDIEARQPSLLAIGALLPGEQAVVPDELQRDLDRQQQAFGRERFFVAAQPAKSGDVWFVSVNRVDRNGRVSHEVQAWTPSPAVRQSARMLTLTERLRDYFSGREMPKLPTPRPDGSLPLEDDAD